MQPLSDAELDDLARELHRMWHAGASQAEMLGRLRTRISRGRWREIPWLERKMFDPILRRLLKGVTGPGHCGPGHDVVLCDGQQPARQV